MRDALLRGNKTRESYHLEITKGKRHIVWRQQGTRDTLLRDNQGQETHHQETIRDEAHIFKRRQGTRDERCIAERQGM